MLMLYLFNFRYSVARGAGPDLLGKIINPAAPGFAMFEAWALVLPTAGDFPNVQLSHPRFSDHH